jgi:hypothetical protein
MSTGAWPAAAFKNAVLQVCRTFDCSTMPLEIKHYLRLRHACSMVSAVSTVANLFWMSCMYFGLQEPEFQISLSNMYVLLEGQIGRYQNASQLRGLSCTRHIIIMIVVVLVIILLSFIPLIN